MVLLDNECKTDIDLPGDEIDDGAEVPKGLEAVRPIHRCFDLAVQVLDDHRRGPIVDELKDPLPVMLDRLCRLDHLNRSEN